MSAHVVARLRFLAPWLLLFPFGCADPPPAAPDNTPPPPDDGTPAPARVLVVNQSETLSSLDLATGEMKIWAATLGTWANRVTVVPGSETLLVTASGDNEIQLLSAHDLAVRGSIDLGPGSNPWIAVPIDDRSAVVSNWVAGNVRRIDLAGGGPGPPLPTTAGPEGVAVADGRAWVACTNYRGGDGTYGEGRVEVVDLASWSIVKSIPVARNPQDVAIAPDGRIHVLCTGTYGTGPVPEAGSVSVIDPSTLEVAGTVPLGASPGRIAIDTRGTAWIAGYAGGMRRYDAATLSLLPDPVDPALGAPSLSAIAVDEEDNRVYVTSFELDGLIAVDRETLVIEDFWLVGDGPVDVLVFRSED